MNIRIYANRSPLFGLGPLGCFEVGQRVDIPGHGAATIVNLDDDGGGVAYLDEALAAEAERRSVDVEQVIAGRSNVRTCYAASHHATALQVEQMAHVAAVNRERYAA